MTTYILGINAFHGDSSACLIRDGELIAAAEEERFRRIKHWAGFPSESIRYCLAEAGLELADVEHVAINSDPRAQFWAKLRYALKGAASPGLILEKIRVRKRRQSLGEALTEPFPGSVFRARVHRVEHHLAHLASAFHVSPFDEAVAVSVDGFGDFSSGAWGMGRGTDLRADGYVRFPHSLGAFYEAMTQYLGFPYYGDEYKVMGLAPYGEPGFVEPLRRVLKSHRDGTYELNLKYFRHHRERIGYEWAGAAPQVNQLYSSTLEELLGPARRADEPLEQKHRDIARSVQQLYEEAFLALLNKLHERYRVDNLALAGGCAMNSVANGKILRQTPFRRLYVHAAAGDAGGAVGAAFQIWRQLNTASERFRMNHAYWGPSYDNQVIGELLTVKDAELKAQGCTVEQIADEDELCRRTAVAIADGQVIGWFQGRMEWGPRALGNRSILCDPRRPDMKDLLNRKIKRRESFRPFAPSILREHVATWFEVDDDVPFMTQVYPIRTEKRAAIPAVTHVDGTGRLQTVRERDNPRYYRLIDAFRALTGVPMLLNTSFNENEPVVCTPEEALGCFLRTKMDVLVLGNWMVRRGGVETSEQ